jgi:simple sugar transport system substrate-binding protein
MKHPTTARLAAFGAAALLLAACNQAAVPAAPNAEQIKDAVATAAPLATKAAEAIAAATTGDFTVGMILVGPANDKGWNQAHFEGIQEYAMKEVKGLKFEYVDKVNPGDRPNVKASTLAQDLVAKGAKMIIFNSDDFKDDAAEFAKKNPTISVIHASGDYSWKEGKNFKDIANLANTMPEMEYGHMINGCSAALQTQTGKIAILGPLINEETRRYVSSEYLGAKYCWEKYRGKKAADLKFKVEWIGFWFNIPGVTSDPTKVADQLYADGYDVVVSNIDTPEAAIEARKSVDSGKKVNYVHYGHPAGCETQSDLCVGVAYYNWGPEYTNQIKLAQAGQFKQAFVRMPADWANIDNRTKTGFGWKLGAGANDDVKKNINAFITGLGDGSIKPLSGPIKLQDGADWVAEGKTAALVDMWYLPQLVQGVEGKSK